MDSTRRNLLIGSILSAFAVGGLLPSTCALSQMAGTSATRNSPRERPEGKGKPLLDEDITTVLARLDAWYAAHLPADKYVFNPPATDAQLDVFERLIGLRLPRSYRQLYTWHDGENDDRWGHLYGLPILSLEQAASDWMSWTKTLATFGGNRYMVPAGAWPDGAVDPAYINPCWIPLTSDGSGGSHRPRPRSLARRPHRTGHPLRAR